MALYGSALYGSAVYADGTIWLDPVLSRVRIALDVSGVSGVPDHASVTRYVGGVGTPVRGAEDLDATTEFVELDDYEFVAGVQNSYLVAVYDALGANLGTYSLQIVPDQGATWLKSLTRPFLNRAVTVVEASEVLRPGRGAVFEVLGSRSPVAVTEVRGSRRFELTLRAADREEAEELALFLSFGDALFFQPPAGCSLPDAGYFSVGDVTEERGRGRHDTAVRYFSLPLTEVRAPDASVVGYTSTWGGVANTWAIWSQVDNDVPTWQDLAQSVSTPSVEVVG